MHGLCGRGVGDDRWLAGERNGEDARTAGGNLPVWIGHGNHSRGGRGVRCHREVQGKIGRVVVGDAVQRDPTTVHGGGETVGKTGARIEEARAVRRRTGERDVHTGDALRDDAGRTVRG